MTPQDVLSAVAYATGTPVDEFCGDHGQSFYVVSSRGIATMMFRDRFGLEYSKISSLLGYNIPGSSYRAYNNAIDWVRNNTSRIVCSGKYEMGASDALYFAEVRCGLKPTKRETGDHPIGKTPRERWVPRMRRASPNPSGKNGAAIDPADLIEKANRREPLNAVELSYLTGVSRETIRTTIRSAHAKIANLINVESPQTVLEVMQK